MVTIRKGTPDDAPAMVEFQIRMAWETERITLDRNTVTAGVRAVFEDPRKGTYWVAERDGGLVGSLLALPEWSDWRNGTVLWIHSLYVVPEARRQGVFSLLYGTLKRHVDSSPDLKGLRLYVEKQNRVARTVYESLGMTDEHYQLYEWLKE